MSRLVWVEPAARGTRCVRCIECASEPARYLVREAAVCELHLSPEIDALLGDAPGDLFAAAGVPHGDLFACRGAACPGCSTCDPLVRG
jgi:hypothetical protein